MNKTPASSGDFESARYDPKSMTLEIKFHNGEIYQYARVPKSVYDGLDRSAAPGEYFTSQIRGKYMPEIRIKEEDFIDLVLRLIKNGQKDEAAKKIVELSDDRKLNVLDFLIKQLGGSSYLYLHFYLAIVKVFYWIKDYSALSRELVSALTLSRDLVRNLALTLNREHDLKLTRNIVIALDLALEHAFVSDIVRASALTRDLASALSLDLALTLDRDINLAPNRLNFLNLVIRHCYSLANGIGNLAFASYVLSLSLETRFSRDMINEASSIYYRNLAGVLDEALSLQQEAPSGVLEIVAQVIETILEDNPLYITLQGVDRITPDVLTNQVGPYLQGLNMLLHAHAKLKKKPFSELRIVQIHNDEPTAELKGAADLLQVANDVLSLPKRKDAEELRRLEIRKKKLEVDLLEKENEQRYAQMALQRPITKAETRARLQEIEINAQRAQIQLRREIETLERDLAQEKYEIYFDRATEFVQKRAPHLPFDQQLPHIIKVALAFQQMDHAELQLRYGHNPRPTTSPSLPDPSDKP